MMLNEDLKPKLIDRLCRIKGIEPTEEVVSLLMSFPYRIVAKPLILIDSKSGKYTYQDLANNYNLSHRQISYIVANEVYD